MTPTARNTFLARLAACGNVTAAARAAGLGLGPLYGRRRRDPALAQAWTIAEARGVAALIAESDRRVTGTAVADGDAAGTDPTRYPEALIYQLIGRHRRNLLAPSGAINPRAKTAGSNPSDSTIPTRRNGP